MTMLQSMVNSKDSKEEIERSSDEKAERIVIPSTGIQYKDIYLYSSKFVLFRCNIKITAKIINTLEAPTKSMLYYVTDLQKFKNRMLLKIVLYSELANIVMK